MRRRLTLAAILLIVASLPSAAQTSPSADERARWDRHAAAVRIVRDDWGIAHVTGRTDADAVFGMIYAQAEDDFNRIETNYLTSMGRLAEAEGESAMWRDLRMRLFITPDSIRARYAAAPAWLRTLMVAWADGLNFYLATHPTVRPRVLTRFEPWMALTFSEGSIGGDIESISLARLEAFYGGRAAAPGPEADTRDREPRGSNGIAIAPSHTTNGRALLLINPHTSFFFRSELQMTSEEGLNAYGAVTWGQFFIYQGFNDRAGWMHTTSSVDAVDEYAETIVERDGRRFYRHGAGERPVQSRDIILGVRTPEGMTRRIFTVHATHHGPIVREADGRWIAVRLMHDPVKALSQSYLRTKARSLPAFRQSMDLHTNSSNNTLYADADGNIAYFHANFVPRRDPRFDWSRAVDGADPATEWGPVHTVDESPLVVNPPTGWVQNTNNWAYSAAGPASPARARFPAYMDAGTENPRGVHAIRVLEGRRDFTVQGLIDAAYDSYLTAFDDLLPPLFAAWDALPAGDGRRASTAEHIAALRAWDRRWSATSIPTSLAVFWGEELWRRSAAAAANERRTVYDFMRDRTSGVEKLDALSAAADSLTAGFGSWRTPWGEINRFQRLTGDIVQPFSDAGPSIPVPFTSARWGSLASFGARAYPGTRRWYGTSGNSFVAVVEFGRDSVRARAVSAGGESGDPASPHFNDQAHRYAAGDLRPVYFYPGQLAGHTERSYRPGERSR